MLSRVSSYFLANVRQIQNIMLNIFKIKKENTQKTNVNTFLKDFMYPPPNPHPKSSIFILNNFCTEKKQKINRLLLPLNESRLNIYVTSRGDNYLHLSAWLIP